MLVKELMSEDVMAVTPETSLKKVARLLAERRVSGMPVLGERGQVLGVVSAADIVLKERRQEHRRTLVHWLLNDGSLEREKLAARTAGEAMTSPAITIGAHTDVSEAARLMTHRGVKRLPVIDWAGVLVGIVTRADLVRAFARADEEIQEEIRSLVTDVFWGDGQAMDIHVDQGDVTIDGELDRQLDAELLPRLVARIPGVLSVRSKVGWRFADDSAPEPHTLESVR
jgi:CBS domain-containing protein